MKRKIAAAVIFIAGICVLMYPVVGNIINVYRQNAIQDEYRTAIEQITEDNKQKIKTEAEEYNERLANGEIAVGNVDEDAVGADYDDGSGYAQAMDVGTEAIAFIKIPKIKVDLPIFRGTATLTLEHGVGHLRNSSLPVGGINSHCVLTGHTGLPSSMLFTDLTKMEQGDMFYIEYLDEIHAYKVDQIKVVEPSDTSDLKIVQGKDYVTLLTCTPYGINSHRLLVRGERVPYDGSLAYETTDSDTETSVTSTDTEVSSESTTVTATVDTAVVDENLTQQIQSDLQDDAKMVSVYGLYVPLWTVIAVPIALILLIISAVTFSIIRSKKEEKEDVDSENT